MEANLSVEIDRLQEENARLRAALNENSLVVRLVDKTELKGLNLHHEVIPLHEGLLVVVRPSQEMTHSEMETFAEEVTAQVHEVGPIGMRVAVLVTQVNMTVDAFLTKR